MNRVAFLWLIVATLVGCSGGAPTALHDPGPVPVAPQQLPENLDRHPHQDEIPIGGSGSISNDSAASGSPRGSVDWIEFRTPPFVRGETEHLLLHLKSPCDEISWETISEGYVNDVRSDWGETHSGSYGEYPDPINRTWTPNAGHHLQCVPYETLDVTIECTIRRGDTSSIITTTWTPLGGAPHSGALSDYGIVGSSGQPLDWMPGLTDSSQVTWDFGGGAIPNSAEGAEPGTTILGAPGRYTASYTIRNQWGFSAPQKIGYWVQPPYTNYVLPLDLSGTPTLLVVDDRIRMLLPTTQGYRYAEALSAAPSSIADWHISDLPLPESHSQFMRMGLHADHLLIVGGTGTIGSEAVVLYYRAAVASPRSTEDWDVGAIPGSEGVEVFDIELDADHVGLLVRKDDDLALLWDDTPILSQWRVSEVAVHPYQSRFESNDLMLTEPGPVIIGFNLDYTEPSGLMYRSATWDAPETWTAHQILGTLPGEDVVRPHLACVYQERPLVLARLTRFSSALLRSNIAHPTNISNWERLETSHVITGGSTPSRSSVHVDGDRILMIPVAIDTTTPGAGRRSAQGALMLEGDPAELTQWTPFLAPVSRESESIVGTVFTNDAIGVLSRIEGELRFGMITP